MPGKALHGNSFTDPQFVSLLASRSRIDAPHIEALSSQTNMNCTLRSISLAIIAFAAPVLSGQITFTLTATATSNAGGYIQNEIYSFSFVTGTSFGNNISSSFDTSPSGRNNWAEEEPADGQIWTSVTGDGLSGGLIRTSDPFSNLTISAAFDDAVIIFIGTDTSETTGLLAPSMAEIYQISLRFGGGDMPAFVYPGSYVDPLTYFSDYEGSFTPDPANQNFTLEDVNFNAIGEFDITGVTISVTPVPEPSAYAALVGLAGLALACNRRRRCS